MVTEVLLTLVVGFVEWFVGLVPDFGLTLNTLDLAGVWSGLGTAASGLNGWVPLTAMVGSLVAYLTVQVVMSVWGLIVWVYHQFWGSD